ncbi:conserved hypothetical protein [Acidovorax delafieldii 2AN]|uniref:Lipoprotein n=1 Tax=Acidovorax delafieldii 2AN TaxID=573060 RepID=C5T6B6_ACIDE|nr:hypothetical protein [Acidovorax delafieldii]EER59991.1 conserved hypothetical protein [Acidovorax delafieldii 2AN]
MKWTLPLAASLLLAACSPALNWRSVPLDGAALTATLPCKPEHAARTVEMAGMQVELAMVGCDADGATFAVSHTALPDPARADAALAHWRAAMLARLGAAQVASEMPFAPRGALALPSAVQVLAQGRRPDGTAVTAQAVWFARTMGVQVHLYHAVVYTAKPRPDVADALFAGLELQ